MDRRAALAMTLGTALERVVSFQPLPSFSQGFKQAQAMA